MCACVFVFESCFKDMYTFRWWRRGGDVKLVEETKENNHLLFIENIKFIFILKCIYEINDIDTHTHTFTLNWIVIEANTIETSIWAWYVFLLFGFCVWKIDFCLFGCRRMWKYFVSVSLFVTLFSLIQMMQFIKWCFINYSSNNNIFLQYNWKSNMHSISQAV